MQQSKVTFFISLFAVVAIIAATVLFFWQALLPSSNSLTSMTSSFMAEATIVNSQTKPSLLISLKQQAPTLATPVLQAGLTAYQYAELHHIVHQPYLAIIDMVLPSSAKRLWVFDLHTRQLMLHDLVAHGKGSGVVYATHFSNEVNSDATSIGVYRTGKAYVGNDGLSLRLYGLEPGFNDNAYQRDIVIHGAAYVSEVFVKQYHRTGRSWGCPAVSLHNIKPLIHLLQNGALVLIYYPQREWLQRSVFLH